MASPYPNGYKRMGNVGIPSEDDLVEMRRQGRDTIMNFGGAEPARVGGGDLMQGLRELLQEKPQPPPQQPIAPTGLEPLEMAYGQDYQIPGFDQPQVKSPRPPQSYGLNRGGTGSAGRKTSEPQFGQSQFDLGSQSSQPEDEMSIADLRKLDDKPWELDPNTNADVASGTKLDVEPEKPDLSTRQGLYDALSQRYPNMLQKNLDYLDQAQIKPEELESLGDRAGMGSLFIAASKAASGAGTVGGKSPESIAKGIVEREDTLARQKLKDRLDVASTNLSMNAKAVDLAMKQIDFADEREQDDPNSEVSRFARQFLMEEFQVRVPDTVSAYQLRQFLPAIQQKYQSQERARYQSALLGQRTDEQELNEAFRQLKLAQEKGDREAERQLRMDIAQLKSQADKEKRETPKPEKMLGGVPAELAKVEMDLARQFRADKTVLAHQLMQNEMRQLEALAAEGNPQSDQALITKFAKILDPGSVVRETEFAITEKGGGVLTSLQNTLDKARGTGRLQPEQRAQMLQAARSLTAGVNEEYAKKRKEFSQQGSLYGARPEAIIGAEPVAPSAGAKPSGRSVEEIDAEIAQIKAEKAKRKGGQ
jgi:hypothetical protein